MRQAARYDIRTTEGLAQKLKLTFLDGEGNSLSLDGRTLRGAVLEDRLIDFVCEVTGDNTATIAWPQLIAGKHRYDVFYVDGEGNEAPLLYGMMDVRCRVTEWVSDEPATIDGEAEVTIPLDEAGEIIITEALAGPKGDKGDTPVIEAGTTTTGEPDSSAEVKQRTEGGVIYFDFAIPRGAQGLPGKDAVLPWNLAYTDQSQTYSGNNIYNGTSTFNGAATFNGGLTASGNSPSNNASDVLNLSTWKYYDTVINTGYDGLPYKWDSEVVYGTNGGTAGDGTSQMLFKRLVPNSANMANTGRAVFSSTMWGGIDSGQTWRVYHRMACLVQISTISQSSAIGVHAGATSSFSYPYPGQENFSTGQPAFGVFLEGRRPVPDTDPQEYETSFVLYCWDNATQAYQEARATVPMSGWTTYIMGFATHPTQPLILGLLKQIGSNQDVVDDVSTDGWTILQLPIQSNVNAAGLVISNANHPTIAPANGTNSKCNILNVHIRRASWLQGLLSNYNL